MYIIKLGGSWKGKNRFKLPLVKRKRSRYTENRSDEYGTGTQRDIDFYAKRT